MLSSCVTPAYMNALDTMALTEKQQEKVPVCENNLVRRTVGAKGADMRRMDKLKVEVGVKESVKNILARSKLKWAGHVETMGVEKLAMIAEAEKVERKRRRGTHFRCPVTAWAAASDRSRTFLTESYLKDGKFLCIMVGLGDDRLTQASLYHLYFMTLSNRYPPRRTPHAARRTPHAARRTPHAARRTPHAARRTPHAARRTPHAARRTPHAPHAARRTPHAARRTPHAARRTPHAARRTPHAARRTPHAARRTPPAARRTTHDARRTTHDARPPPTTGYTTVEHICQGFNEQSWEYYILRYLRTYLIMLYILL